MWAKIKKWLIIAGISLAIIGIAAIIIVKKCMQNKINRAIRINNHRLNEVQAELEQARQSYQGYVDQLERMRQLRNQYREGKK